MHFHILLLKLKLKKYYYISFERVNEIKYVLVHVEEVIDNCYSPYFCYLTHEGIRLHTCQFSKDAFKRGKYVNPPFIKPYIKLNATPPVEKEGRKDDNANLPLVATRTLMHLRKCFLHIYLVRIYAIRCCITNMQITI